MANLNCCRSYVHKEKYTRCSIIEVWMSPYGCERHTHEIAPKIWL